MPLFKLTKQGEPEEGDAIAGLVRAENENDARLFMFELSGETEPCWINLKESRCDKVKVAGERELLLLKYHEG